MATALLTGKEMVFLMSSFYILLKAIEVAYESIAPLNRICNIIVLGRDTFCCQQVETSERQTHY